MAQLMAGRLRQTGPGPSGVHDLIQPAGRQRPAPPWALQHHEHPIGAGIGGTFAVEVGGQGSEEPAGDRDLTLMATLAFGDEHPPGADL